jgi:DNA-binding beta-propeller fold protein YncE
MIRSRYAIPLSFLLPLFACDSPESSSPLSSPQASVSGRRGGFEVWLVDQSNSSATPTPHGGRIHIWDGSELNDESAASATAEVIDLAGATAALCNSSTGALPVRPHMLFFNSEHTHGVLAFVASGHVVVYNAKTRAPLACLRTSPGAGGARQAHAAVPSPDGSYIVVANQNGKLLERINVNYQTNAYAFDPAATINLATCITPSGAPCEAVGVRPDNAPICPVVEARGRLAFVTLRGGGLFVVDAKATPMTIVGEYTNDVVHGNGCGGSQVDDALFIDSGGGTAANVAEFDLYRFPARGYAASTAANTPAPVRVFSDDTGDRDAHGTAPTPNGKYLWVADRTGNLFEVFNTDNNAHVRTVSIVSDLSADPSPDLMGFAPGGNRMFVSLRGPNPLSGDPHASTGSTPGLGIVQIQQSGRRGVLKAIARISNRDAGGVERADAHGIGVRLK